MAISTEASRTTYTCNGVTTVFSTGFYFLDETEVTVKYAEAGDAETVLTLGVDYTVTMPASVGAAGSITMISVTSTGAALTIQRDVPYTQETSFRTQGTFSREVHEDAMDEVVFQTQQLSRRISDLESAGAPGSVVAGTGLFFSGDTLHVGIGDGLIGTADDVSVSLTNSPSPAVGSGAASPGASTEVARQDHVHALLMDVAPAALVAGAAAALGASTKAARADHTHLTTVGAPVAVDAGANATGATGQFSDAGHKHTVSTAAAVELTDSTNAEGTDATLTRSDHTHAHGNRGGGSLHAVATTSAAGFLSAADKTKLDGLASETISTGSVETTDATPTQILTWTPTDDSAEVVELFVVGKEKNAGNAGGYHRKFVVRRHDTVTALVGTVDTLGADKEDTAGWDITVAVSSPAVIVTVTGAAGDTAVWQAQARRLSVTAA